MNNIQPKCCKLDCDANAEWLIVNGVTPDSYTESCTAHVGELLSDASEHKIYPIRAASFRSADAGETWQAIAPLVAG